MKWSFAVVAAALSAAPVGAVSAPPTPDPMAAAAIDGATGHASVADPERMRLAEAVVQASGGGENVFTSLLETTRTFLVKAQTAAAAKTPVDATTLEKLQRFRAIEDRYLPEMQRATASVYAREFTAEQLREMLAFYTSPVGRTMQAKRAQITSESLIAAQSVFAHMQREVLALQCAEATCTEEQKATLARLQQAAPAPGPP